ncbi:MAG: hypothetical protein IJB91_00485 [Oscillospiraceae bacterium]|nr:hypothetical protein [Oscillospiraceae bacterium]
MKKNNKQIDIIPQLPLMGIPLSMADPVATDPLGSYTGVPENALEQPIQDADDL